MTPQYTSEYSPEKIAVREQAVADGLFVLPPRTRKIACASCGDRGYAGGSWMDKHINGHGPCPDCGESHPLSTMSKHRVHHRRQS